MSDQTRLLVVDDDAEIRNLMEKLLISYGYNVRTAPSGVELFNILRAETIDLILLDILLPGEDGFVLCRKVREKYPHISIIMVTAIGETTDRIVGLEVGADDYLTKPFNPRELVARIKAVTRRSQQNTAAPSTTEDFDNKDILEFDGWRLRKSNRNLMSPDDMEIVLSAGEYDLLCAFLENPQRVLSRDQLLDYTKNRPAGPFDRSIDIQVSRLRVKLEKDPKNPKIIKTVRGGGYLFCPKIKKLTSNG